MINEIKLPEKKETPSVQKKKDVGKDSQEFTKLFDQAVETEKPMVSKNSEKKNEKNNDKLGKDVQTVAGEDKASNQKENGVKEEIKEEIKEDEIPFHLLQGLVTEQLQFQFHSAHQVENTENLVVGEVENELLLQKKEGTDDKLVQVSVDEMEIEESSITQEKLVTGFSDSSNDKSNRIKNEVEKSVIPLAKGEKEEKQQVLGTMDRLEQPIFVKEDLKIGKSELENKQNIIDEKDQDLMNTKENLDELLVSKDFFQQQNANQIGHNIKNLSKEHIEKNNTSTSTEIYARSGVELKDNLVQTMTQKLDQNQYEMELSLNPEHLGKMSIRITYVNEKATIAILCSSKEVTQMLAEQAKEIGRIMEQHLKADTFISVETKEQDYLEQNFNQSREENPQQESRHKKKNHNTQQETQTFLEQLRLGLA